MGTTNLREPVEVIEWDHYTRDHNLFGLVTMMKIDVEGWESRVLAGGKGVIARPDAPVLQVEFTEPRPRPLVLRAATCTNVWKGSATRCPSMMKPDARWCRSG